jgi:hypothetical protein
MEESKKKELLKHMIPLINDIIETDFSTSEKNELIKVLKYLKTNLHDLFSHIFDVIDEKNLNPSITIEMLSYSNKYSEESITLHKKIFSNGGGNQILDKNLSILFYRLSLLFQVRLNNYFNNSSSDIEKDTIFKLEQKTLILAHRFGMNTDLVHETKSKKTFRAEKVFKRNARIIFKKLQNNFITNPDFEHFEMAFSIKKISKDFKKINWVNSILELKCFINLLMDKNLIVTEINYYEIIADCFTVNSRDISAKQIFNPKGSQKRFQILKDIIEK